MSRPCHFANYVSWETGVGSRGPSHFKYSYFLDMLPVGWPGDSLTFKGFGTNGIWSWIYLTWRVSSLWRTPVCTWGSAKGHPVRGRAPGRARRGASRRPWPTSGYTPGGRSLSRWDTTRPLQRAAPSRVWVWTVKSMMQIIAIAEFVWGLAYSNIWPHYAASR